MRRGVVLGLAALALAGSERVASAQGIGLRQVEGEVGSDFTGRWLDLEAADGPAIQQFSEWMDLRFGGWVLYPGLIDFKLHFSPQLNQNLFENQGISSSNGRTTLNGGADVRILSARRLTYRVYFRRLAQRSWGEFGTNSESDRSVWGIEVRDRNPYLPYLFEYRDNSDDIRFTTGGAQTPVRSDLRTKLLRLTARNSKSSILLQRHVQDDRVQKVQRIRTIARLEHRLRWGKGSQLTSRIGRWKNSGASDSEALTLSEGVILRHRTNLSSAFSYSYSRTSSPSDVQRQSVGQINTNYQITGGIQASALGLGDVRRARSGTHQSTYRVSSRLVLGTNLPLGARARLSGRAGHAWLNQGSDNGLVDVLNEVHPIGATGRFRLNESFAERATVLVRDQDGFLFEPEIDYRLVEVGPLIEIVILPGGRIQLGDTVLVDYQFRLVPGASVRSLLWGYAANLDVGPVRLYHDRSVEDPLDGVSEGLLFRIRDFDERLYGGEVNVPLSFGSLNARAEYRSTSFNGFNSRSKTVSGGLQVNPARRLGVSLSGSLVAQRGDNDLARDIWRAESNVEWSALRNVDLHAGVSYWNWSEPGQRTEFLGGRLGVTAHYRQLRLEARFDRSRWRDGFNRAESRVYVRLIRRL